MMQKAIAVLALLAATGLLPAAAAQEAQEMTIKAVAKVEEEVAEKAEKAEEAAPKGPSLEEVLASHYKALGGAENWQSVESVRFTGKMSIGPGMESPFKMTMQRPGKIRMEFSIQGMTGVQASDGETAWTVMPFMGKTDPEQMPGELARQFEEQADIEGPLFSWADKGHTVELLGSENMEGTDVYKIKLTHANGNVRYLYLDSEYFVTIKQTGKAKVQGQELEFETTIGDYKSLCLETSSLVEDEDSCEGKEVRMPFSIESQAKGMPNAQVITIESVTINPDDIAEDYFAMPAKAAAGAAKEAESGD